jgi:hypothetical protein
MKKILIIAPISALSFGAIANSEMMKWFTHSLADIFERIKQHLK